MPRLPLVISGLLLVVGAFGARPSATQAANSAPLEVGGERISRTGRVRERTR